MKKGDLVIVALVIVVAMGWFLKDIILPDTSDKHAVIKVDTDIYTTLPLDSSKERQEIPVRLPGNNYVHVITEKDEIWVEDASCPDKVCVNTGIISKSGQSIVCLPNKTVVYIEGTQEDPNVDDVTY